MKKITFILLILALLIGACAAPAEPTTPSVDEEPEEGGLPDLGGRELTIATDPFPPYTFVADDASIIGFDPDLLTEICGLINCTVNYEVVAWDGIFAGVAAGEYDLVGGGPVYTEERDEVVDFTIPYYLAGAAVVVSYDEDEILTPDDLLKPGVFTAVLRGGDSSEIIAAEFGIPDEQLKHYPTVDLQFLALFNGDVDAVLQLSDSIGEFVYRIYEGKMKVLSNDDGVILLDTFTVHIVTSEDDQDLREALNAGIKQLIEDGTVASLMEKWNMVISIP